MKNPPNPKPYPTSLVLDLQSRMAGWLGNRKNLVGVCFAHVLGLKVGLLHVWKFASGEEIIVGPSWRASEWDAIGQAAS